MPALLVAWSIDEPGRLGEAVLVPSGSPAVLGRGDKNAGSDGVRLRPTRQRPGRNEWTGAIQSPRISRDQLQLEALDGGLMVRNLGRAALLVNGDEVREARVRPGDVLELKNRLVLLVGERPLQLPHPGPGTRWESYPFGDPDPYGIVGESPSVWELRERIAFVAARNAHVLVKGPSGTGKELVAGAIHALSERGGKRIVSRNAATFPETLIDAELFGNVRDYPNPGMKDRPGLIGESDGSTLFLDEIGELPGELQAHLLRVLDDGEYQRLGETNTRRSDFRLIGATNRPVVDLKHDFAARLQMHVELPDLNERREDIPLLTRHMLRRIAQDDPEITRRFFVDGDPKGHPRMSPALAVALVQHHYTTHVRELSALLWQSMASSRGNYLDLTEDLPIPAEAPAAGHDPQAEDAGVDPSDLTPEAIQSCLDKHEGVQERVWRELGLKNRFQLYRLIKKFDLVVENS